MSPAIVMMLGESDIHEWPPLWTLGLADEMHVGLVRQPVALAGIAGDARADDIFPSGLAAAIAGHHVVEIQVAAVEDTIAVLAGICIALEDVMPCELDLFLRETLEKQKDNNARNANLQADRSSHIRFRIGLGKIFPALEVVCEEVVLLVSRNHLRVALIEEREGSPGRAGIYSLPEAIEHKNRLIQDRFHISIGTFSVPRTGGEPGKLAEAITPLLEMSTPVNSL
jgi:hypothetical protein